MRVIENETGAQRLLGYVLEVEGDTARCRLRLTEDHTNRHGGLHGGIAASVLDNAMGAAASLRVDSEALPPVLTLTMTINFHSPAGVGDALVAHARVTGGGRATMFVAGELYAGDRLIATASGVFKRPRPKP